MNTRTLRTKLLLPLAMVLTTALHANNIQVTNTTLVDNTGSTVKVQFDISWENSWRGEGVANWDAAWVFVKYKLSNGSWGHVRLSNSGHTAPAGSLLEMGLLTPGTAHDATTNPVIGTFLRRDADGTGTFTATGVQLFWDYAAQGIIASNDIASVQVFAIEMVYMNEGPFKVGTGGAEANGFKTGPTSAPYPIPSEGAITIANSTGALWANGVIEASTLPAAFPKGYRAAYVMKYEISQQQYADFLNTLSRSQQIFNVQSDLAVNGFFEDEYYALSGQDVEIYRQAIVCTDPGINAGPVQFTANRPYVACNYLNSGFLSNYLDWSGLRPMTELEYEKACRGPLPPVVNEFAWASAVIAPTCTSYTLASGGSDTESIATGYNPSSGNANFTVAGGDVFLVGPYRVGIFAAHASNTGRTSSGAGYYGAMDLTGNVLEQVVTTADAQGRAYTGTHGDGQLGGGLPATWPTALMGKGGSFYSAPNTAGPVSVRGTTGTVGPYAGGRGIRTAP